MKKLLKGLLASVAIYTAFSALPQESKAIGPNGLYPSAEFIGYTCLPNNNLVRDNIFCLLAGYPPNLVPPFWDLVPVYWWQFDPPVNDVTSISFEFFFNPDRFAPIVDSAGFLCSFTSSGNCPIASPGVGTQPIGITMTPPITGPANGTQSIVVGSNSVSVNATFSSPITAESDELFFAMQFEPLFEIKPNSLVTYSQELLPDADYSVISYSCTTLDNVNNCGSENGTRSFKVITVPEPSSPLSLLAIGIGGLGLTLKRKMKNSKSTEKDTTKIG